MGKIHKPPAVDLSASADSSASETVSTTPTIAGNPVYGLMTPAPTLTVDSAEIALTAILSRPSWDEYFIDIAHAASRRATCPRRRVGCVLVDSRKHIVATGYNGAPGRKPHCDHADGGMMHNGHCTNARHAEFNAVQHCSKESYPVTAYVTVQPCFNCAMHLLRCGIMDVVYDEPYGNPVYPEAMKVRRLCRNG